MSVLKKVGTERVSCAWLREKLVGMPHPPPVTLQLLQDAGFLGINIKQDIV